MLQPPAPCLEKREDKIVGHEFSDSCTCRSGSVEVGGKRKWAPRPE